MGKSIWEGLSRLAEDPGFTRGPKVPMKPVKKLAPKFEKIVEHFADSIVGNVGQHGSKEQEIAWVEDTLRQLCAQIESAEGEDPAELQQEDAPSGKRELIQIDFPQLKALYPQSIPGLQKITQDPGRTPLMYDKMSGTAYAQAKDGKKVAWDDGKKKWS